MTTSYEYLHSPSRSRSSKSALPLAALTSQRPFSSFSSSLGGTGAHRRRRPHSSVHPLLHTEDSLSLTLSDDRNSTRRTRTRTRTSSGSGFLPSLSQTTPPHPSSLPPKPHAHAHPHPRRATMTGPNDNVRIPVIDLSGSGSGSGTGPSSGSAGSGSGSGGGDSAPDDFDLDYDTITSSSSPSSSSRGRGGLGAYVLKKQAQNYLRRSSAASAASVSSDGSAVSGAPPFPFVPPLRPKENENGDGDGDGEHIDSARRGETTDISLVMAAHRRRLRLTSGLLRLDQHGRHRNRLSSFSVAVNDRGERVSAALRKFDQRNRVRTRGRKLWQTGAGVIRAGASGRVDDIDDILNSKQLVELERLFGLPGDSDEERRLRIRQKRTGSAGGMSSAGEEQALLEADVNAQLAGKAQFLTDEQRKALLLRAKAKRQRLRAMRQARSQTSQRMGRSPSKLLRKKGGETGSGLLISFDEVDQLIRQAKGRARDVPPGSSAGKRGRTPASVFGSFFTGNMDDDDDDEMLAKPPAKERDRGSLLGSGGRQTVAEIISGLKKDPYQMRNFQRRIRRIQSKRSQAKRRLMQGRKNAVSAYVNGVKGLTKSDLERTISDRIEVRRSRHVRALETKRVIDERRERELRATIGKAEKRRERQLANLADRPARLKLLDRQRKLLPLVIFANFVESVVKIADQGRKNREYSRRLLEAVGVVRKYMLPKIMMRREKKIDHALKVVKSNLLLWVIVHRVKKKRRHLRAVVSVAESLEASNRFSKSVHHYLHRVRKAQQRIRHHSLMRQAQIELCFRQWEAAQAKVLQELIDEDVEQARGQIEKHVQMLFSALLDSTQVDPGASHRRGQTDRDKRLRRSKLQKLQALIKVMVPRMKRHFRENAVALTDRLRARKVSTSELKQAAGLIPVPWINPVKVNPKIRDEMILRGILQRSLENLSALRGRNLRASSADLQMVSWMHNGELLPPPDVLNEKILQALKYSREREEALLKLKSAFSEAMDQKEEEGGID